MELKLEWGKPIPLKHAFGDGLVFSFDHTKVEREPGVYVFGRLHGSKFEALYVGKADNLQARTLQHLNNLKLMMHIETAKTGKKVLLVGLFKPKRGQQPKRCLPILERAIIRHYLAEGHDLANIQGTLLMRHEISSSGSSHVPKLVFVDRNRGE